MRAVCKLPDGSEIDYDPYNTARVGNREYNEDGHNVIAMQLKEFEFEEVKITTTRSGYWNITLDKQDYLDHKGAILEIINKQIRVEEKDEDVILVME